MSTGLVGQLSTFLSLNPNPRFLWLLPSPFIIWCLKNIYSLKEKQESEEFRIIYTLVKGVKNYKLLEKVDFLK